jgi:hypothetical protein
VAATNQIIGALEAGTNVLRDIKPPVDIPSGWAWLWWTLAVLAALTASWLAWRHWKSRKAAALLEPAVPPHIRAMGRLDAALALLHDPREFCIAVSDTVRWYLEERFNFRAPERTTEEFLQELKNTSLLKRAQKESLGLFLERCDLVKFARYVPGEPELRDLHASAVTLVKETAPTEPAEDESDTHRTASTPPA